MPTEGLIGTPPKEESRNVARKLHGKARADPHGVPVSRHHRAGDTGVPRIVIWIAAIQTVGAIEEQPGAQKGAKFLVA